MPSTDRASLNAIYLTEALIHTNTEAPFSKICERRRESLRQRITLFQCRPSKPRSPPKVVHISSTQSVSDTVPPRMYTPAPRGARIITVTSPRVYTSKTPAPTIIYYCTTRYRARAKKTTETQKTINIPQEEVKIISTLA